MYGLIGLAAKKGSIISGWGACERALKKSPGARVLPKGERGLLILAGDSALNTKEKFLRLSAGKRIDYLVFGSVAELGRRAGRGERSVIIVTDEGLARGIRELLGYVAEENGGV